MGHAPVQSWVWRLNRPTLIVKVGIAALLIAAVSAVPASTATTSPPLQAPYPDSPVIDSITWDFSTMIGLAQGSDLWPTTWGPDDHVYTSWGDGGGFGGTNADGRVSLGFARMEGPPESFVGVNVWGGKASENPAQFTGKTAGILSVDGVLYAWLNTQNSSSPDFKLAWSTDLGATWQRSMWDFASGIFAPASFLNFGRDYAGARDQYVYMYGGRWGFTADVDLVRVPKGDIQNRVAYEYYAGLDGSNIPVWVTDVVQRVPVFTNPEGAASQFNMPLVVNVIYNAAIGRYLLTVPHGDQVSKWGIFDAPEPWGPWTTVDYYENWGGLSSNDALNYSIPTKWISPDGKDLWVIFSGAGGHDLYNQVKGTLVLSILDTSLPSTPTGLQASPVSETQIDVGWTAASDPESGVSTYNIYRDGTQVGTTAGTTFRDNGLAQATTYSYKISALNGAGLEGPGSAVVPGTTFAGATPPALLSARALGTALVEVEFSEPMDSASASLLSNYAIMASDGSFVAVSGASDPVTNAAEGKVVLITDTHVDGVTYTLTASGVTNLAGNSIASSSTVSYVFGRSFVFTGSSPTQYVWDVVEIGAVQYIDRPFNFSTVPQAYLGLPYLKAANDDKGTTGDSLVSFDVSQDVSVYVAHDDRITPKPGWLASFADTGDNLTSRGGSFSLFVKDFPSGTITLGGNEGADLSMYTVVVRVHSSGGATVVVSAGPDASIDEDDTFSSAGYFAGPQGTWTGTVDYGDSSGPAPLALAGNSFTLSHIFSNAGPYTVTVTITDEAAITVTDSIQVHVLTTLPTLPGMTSPARDLDGDGRAEDTNGNGRLDFADVVTLFEHLASAEVQGNHADFDFNNSGFVDMDDIFQLFAKVTV